MIDFFNSGPALQGSSPPVTARRTAVSFLKQAALLVLGSLAFAGAQAATCGQSTSVTLFAGQTTSAGTVTVANDASYLYVTYATSGDWKLQQTHLHVADSLAGIPMTKSGNPKIGNFAYQTTHSPLVTTYTYTIAKSWGFSAARVTTMAVVTGVWNVLSRAALPVIAILGLSWGATDLPPRMREAAWAAILTGGIVLAVFALT